MSLIGNVIWFIFGGIWMGLGWYLTGILMAITINGIPWAKSAFVIGTFAFFPLWQNGKLPIKNSNEITLQKSSTSINVDGLSHNRFVKR